jgi:hypothetical protein
MQQTDVIDFVGGLDIVSPYLRVGQGAVISCQNYESEARGYRRMEGYERFDGRPKPSEAAYWVLDFDSGSTEMAEDDVVTGATSGATGIVLADATLSTGTYGGGDAAGYVVLYNVTGTFQDDEGLEVSASNVATADGAAVQGGASNDTDDTTWLRAAIEKRRDAITAVTGSGAIRGVCTYSGDVYAFRDNAGATAGAMFKASTSGWTAQTFGLTLDFTGGGTAAIAEQDTITGATSAATATVERVVLQSGSWAAGDAAGYLVLSGQAGTFQSENIDTGTQSNIGTIGGDSAAITLPDGGKYRWLVHNFYGTSNYKRLYLVNGEGPALEWDGTVLAPIKTGLSDALEKPTHIGVHNNHLLLGYRGGAVQFSSTGVPIEFNAVDGAGEIGLGEDITGIRSATRKSTVITCRNKISYLTGNDATDFVLSDIAQDSGAVADTLEVVGEPYFLDDRGIRGLSTAQEYGDWSIGTVTRQVEPLISGKKAAGTLAVGAMRVRGKDQYRLFYDDKSVLSVYFGRGTPEVMQFLLEFTPSAVCTGRDSLGDEILFAGDTAGLVYQIDAGTSADGDDIEAFLRTPFLFQKSPITDKRYFRATLDVNAGSVDTTISYSSDYSFGSPDRPSGVEASIDFEGGGGFWDVALWDSFYWDAAVQDQAFAELNGLGTNVSIAIMSTGTYEEPHTLSSLTVNYAPRRSAR